jgi:hypothetical protein
VLCIGGMRNLYKILVTEPEGKWRVHLKNIGVDLRIYYNVS